MNPSFAVLEDELQYYKTKSSQLESGYLKLQNTNKELKDMLEETFYAIDNGKTIAIKTEIQDLLNKCGVKVESEYD